MKASSLLFVLWLVTTPHAIAYEPVFYPVVKQLCLKELPTSRPQCNALIDELESKNNVPDLLRLATAYINLGFKAPDSKTRELLNNKVTSTYTRALKIEPTNVTALYGSSIYLPADEKVKIWQHILTIDPKYESVLTVLAKTLLNGNTKQREEGIQVLKRGYPQFEGKQRYFLAAMLYDAYDHKADKLAREQLRNQILQDMDINLHQSSYQTAINQLPKSCAYFSMRFDGENICLQSIRLIANHDNPTTVRLKQDSAKLVKALTTLLPRKHKLQKQFPDVQVELRDLLEDINATGEQPQEFYLLYAQLQTGKHRIATLQKAASMTVGKPGQTESWLAKTLFDNGQYDEAIALYEKLIKHGTPPYSNSAKTYLQIAMKKRNTTTKINSDRKSGN